VLEKDEAHEEVPEDQDPPSQKRARARAKAHSKAGIWAWGKQGGRPTKLDSKALARLRQLRAEGKTQADSASELGVSVRSIGRVVAKMGSGAAHLRGSHCPGEIQSQTVAKPIVPWLGWNARMFR